MFWLSVVPLLILSPGFPLLCRLLKRHVRTRIYFFFLSFFSFFSFFLSFLSFLSLSFLPIIDLL